MGAMFSFPIINICKGDLISQTTDAIVVCSDSLYLFEHICKAGGDTFKKSVDEELKNNHNSPVISIKAQGTICSKFVYFLRWKPSKNTSVLVESLKKFVRDAIQMAVTHKHKTIAFPAIGCGYHRCPIDCVAETMIKEAAHLSKCYGISVSFIILSEKTDMYNEFEKQMKCLITNSELNPYTIPSTWEKSSENKMRIQLSTASNEYKTVLTGFEQTMKTKCTQIIRIERIQNKSWYIQYIAHKQNFKERLNKDTEKILYHGCPGHVVDSIIQRCFDRSFAGTHGKVYGAGAYFSANALFSHDYAKENSNGERNMFISRVLIGETTQGTSSMKTPPPGFDSTTDGNHIFVTYHDAQAYAEYLITYK